MLDFKPLSVRQLFKTFGRIETYLSSHYRAEELNSSDFFLSSNARMHIFEDMIDVYLSYIYHKELKLSLIEELVNYTQTVAA